MLKRSAGRSRWRRGLLRVSVSRISLVLGAGGIVLILASAAFTAWHEREVDYREARTGARSSALSLSDHAARLFEVADIALRATTLKLGDASWDEIEASRGLWAEMKATDAALPFVSARWLNDETGRLRLTPPAIPPPPGTIAARPIFAAARDDAPALLIGDPVVGRILGKLTFLIARRLDGPDGGFRGLVSATAELSYFTGHWARLDLPEGEDVSLVRPSSGRVLVSFPEEAGDGPAIGLDSLRTEIAAEPTAGRFKPSPGRAGFYHQVGTLPLYVAVSFRYAAVERAWRGWLWTFLPFPAAAVLALAVILALARRQSRIEALASRDVNRAQAQLAALNQALERRVAERTADLQDSNAEIQRFAYIVSHDLRAPLVNITGFTSELQRLRAGIFAERDPSGAAVALRDDFDEAIGFIQSSIDKMDRLIKAILTLARQGNRAFAPEPVDTDGLMRSVVDGVAHRLQAAGARVTVEPLPALVADRIAVEQIFSNLVDNAVKYLRPGVPGEMPISATPMGDRVAIRVADNGRGIAPRDHGRVFELFRRAGTQDRPGDGIGLAHVRALVRRLGGTISLTSTLGDGTTFTVVLPLKQDGAGP